MSFDKYFKHGSSESFDVRAASPQQAAAKAVQPSSYDKYFEKNTAKTTPATSVAVKKTPQKEKQTFWEKAAEKTKSWFTSPEDNTGHQIVRNPYTGMSMRIGFSPEVQKKYDDIVSEIDYLESVKGYVSTVEQADELQAQIDALSEEASGLRQSVGLEDKSFTSSERLEDWGNAWGNQFASAYVGAAGNVSELYTNRYDVGTDEKTYNALTPEQQAEYDRLMAQREQLEQSRAYVTTVEQSDELEAAFKANTEALQAIAPTDQSKAEALHAKSDELNREYQKSWNKATYGQSDAEIFLMQAGHQGLNIAADSLATIATIPLGGWGGKVSMAGRIYGQTASEARRQGDDVYTAAKKGITSAAIETISEMIGGGFDKVYGESLISGAVGKFVSNPIVKGAIDALGEGAEEGLASVMQLAADHMFGWSKSGNTFLEDVKANSGDMVYEMLLGTFVGVFGASGQIAIDSAREAEAIAAFAKVYGGSAEDIIQQGLDRAEGSKAYRMALNNQEKLAQNGKLSDADLYAQFKANIEQIEAEGRIEETSVPESTEPSTEAADAYLQKVQLHDAATAAAEAEMDRTAEPSNAEITEPPTPDAEQEAVEVSNVPDTEQPETPKAETKVQPTKSKALHDSYADMESDNSNIESYAAKYEGRAADVQNAYSEGQDVAEFGKSFDAAYRMGESMLPKRSLGKVQNLTDEQKQIAFQMGRDAAKERATTRALNVFGKGTGGRGVVSGEGISLADVRKKFNDAQNTAYRVLDKFARATGMNIVLFASDESGSREEGSFSWKDNTIRININSGVFSSGDVKDLSKYTALRTFSHELTHFTEKWNAEQYDSLREFVFEALDAKGVDVDERIQLRMAAGLSYDMAAREVVADSMADMLGQSDIFERLAQKDAGMAQSLLNKLKEFLARLKQAFKSMTTQNNYEAEVLKDTIGYSEELVKKWTDVLEGSIEAYNADAVTSEGTFAPGSEGVVVNSDGQPVAMSTEEGTVQLSLRTYEEDGRDAFRNYLEKCVSSNRLTKAEMREMLDSIEEIYTVCKEFKDKYAPFSTWSDAKVVRDTYGKPVFSVVTPNGDYKMNLDFSLVCKKRRALDAVFNEMSKRGIIDDFELGQKSVVKINEIIRKHGFETACALCFVDAKRFRQASMADQFTSLYNELVESLVPEEQRSSIGHFNFAGYETIKATKNGIDTWPDSKLDFSHLDKVMKNYGKGTVEYKAAQYIKNHPEGRKLLLRGDFMSSQGFDAVKTQNKSILKLYNSKKGTGGPKAAFGDVQYMNEVIRKQKSWTPAKAYAVGGVRIQSFSDYVPRMVFDYVQMIYDLAATKLPAHAYTKEALFVKQFGLTGIKINMSLIPAIDKNGVAAGLDVNGNYVWAGESFDFETAKQIQNADGYSENCGTICVGVSKQHINKLLSDPDIRMVIPYHKSGLNPIVAHMNKIAAFTDYTDSQRTKGSDGKAISKDFDFNKALHDMGDNGDPKAVAKQYLDWCAANGYTPKFDEFAWHENYYKLLEDFTLYDKNGKYVPQHEVKAIFPKENSEFGSMKALIEQGLQEDAVIEGRRIDNLSKIVDEIERSIPKTEAEIPDVEVEQAKGDVEAQLQGEDQFARGRATLSDRELLEAAAARLPRDKLTESEKLALVDFQKKLDKLKELQEQRAEQGRIYKEQMFTKGRNKEEAQKTKNRMDILDKKINSLENTILSMKDRDVFKKILKSARDMIEREARASEQKTLAEYRAKRNESEGQKKYRDRVIKTVRELMAWISTPSAKEGKRVPLELQEALSGLLSSIDFTSKRALKGGNPTKQDIDFKKKLQAVKDALDKNIEAVGAESGYVDIRPEFSDEYTNLLNKIDSLIGEGEDYVINRMSSEDLKQLSELLKEVKHYIQNANTMHENEVFKTAHEAGDETIKSLGELGKASKHSELAGRFFTWYYNRPAYVFSYFGKGGESVYQEFRKAQGIQARLTKEVLDFSEQTFTPEMAKRWAETTRTFNLDGENVKIPITHIMSMYCLSKREQGLLHLLGGGFRVANFKNGKQTVSDVGHKITKEKLDEILATLDQFPAAKKVADELQKYMSTVCAAWGNEVDMVRFGVPKFLEKNYFPVNSDGRQLAATADEAPKEVSLYALLNAGFTKSLQIGANNRLIVYDIFDVFASHTNSMVQYRSFALPVLDALKWFNHKNGQGVTVRDAMSKAFGSKSEEKGSGGKSYAEDFVINLLKDYNGARQGSGKFDTALLKGLSNINRTRVSFNLSTMLLQPTSIARAGMFIGGNKLLRGFGMAAKDYDALAAEMEKHSGIALWKSLGFYDVNVSRGVAEQIKQDMDWKQKLNELGMKGAEAADRFTWTAIWAASKASVNRAKYKTDAEYFEAVSDVFEEVIYKTQVVDSVLTKAEAQREKGFGAKSVMSFMSESVASTAVLSDAAIQYDLDARRIGKAEAWKKNRKHIGRAVKIWTVSKVISAAMSALVAAWRDDDEYEEFGEKYFSALKEKLIEELNPLSDLPLIGDVISKLQGYDDSSELGQIVNYFTSAYGIIMDKLDKDDDGDYEKYTWWGAMYKVLQGASAILGVPFATASRELVDLWNNTAGRLKPDWKLHTYDPGVQNSIKYAYLDGYISEEEAQQLLIEERAIEEEDIEKAKSTAYWLVQNWQGIGKYDEIIEAVSTMNSSIYRTEFDHLISRGVREQDIYGKVTDYIKEGYLAGNISYSNAKASLEAYGGKEADDAEDIVNALDFELETGYEWDADGGFSNGIMRALEDGAISRQEAIEWYAKASSSTHGSLETAEEYVRVGEWRQSVAGAEDFNVSALEKWDKYGFHTTDAGLAKEDFVWAWKLYDNASAVYSNSGDRLKEKGDVFFEELYSRYMRREISFWEMEALAHSFYSDSYYKRYKFW